MFLLGHENRLSDAKGRVGLPPLTEGVRGPVRSCPRGAFPLTALAITSSEP